MSEFFEIEFACSDPAESRRIHRGLKAKKLRLLVPRTYTSNLRDPLDKIVRSNLERLLDHLYKEAILSHRTALWFPGLPRDQLKETGAVWVPHSHTQRIEWPGVTVFLLQGPKALESDFWIDKHICPGGLRRSSQPRAFLENLQPSRKTNRGAKTHPRAEIAKHLRREGRLKGPESLLQLRAEAEVIAPQLRMRREFEILSGLISAALEASNRPRAKMVRLTGKMGVPPDFLLEETDKPETDGPTPKGP